MSGEQSGFVEKIKLASRSLLGVINDVTERLRTEERLRELERKCQELLASRGGS